MAVSDSPRQSDQANIRYTPFRIAVSYVIASGLWILLSSRLVDAISRNQAEQQTLEEVRAWLFVLISAVTLYYFIRAALQNARNGDQSAVSDKMLAEKALRQRTEQYGSLLDTIAMIGQTLRRDHVLTGILQRIKIIPCDCVEIYLADETGFRLEATSDNAELNRIGSLLSQQEAETLRQLMQEEICIRGTVSDPFPLQGKHPSNWMAVPLSVHSIRVGCMILVRENGEPFQTEDEDLAFGFARFAAVALSNAELFGSLERSEANYRQLINSVEDMVYRADATGTQLFVNAKGREIQQLDPSDSTVQKWIDFIHPDDRADFLKSVEDQFSRGDTMHLEFRMVGKKGRTTLLSHRVRALRDDQGKLIGMFGIGRDITEYKRTKTAVEAHARQQEVVAKLGQRALAGVALDTLMQESVINVQQTLDTDLCHVLELVPHNKTFAIRADTNTSKRPDRIPAGVDSQAGYTVAVQEPVISTNLQQERRFDSTLSTNYGMTSGISVVIPGHDQPFGVLGTYSGKVIEFTRDDANFLQAVANVLAEAIERSRSEQALRDIAERNRAIVNTAADGIITMDEDGIIESANPAAECLFGYTGQELKGRHISTLISIPELGTSWEQSVYNELIGQRKDNSSFAIELTISEMQVAGHRMFTNIVHDITERVKANQSVTRHMRQLSIVNSVLQIASAPVGFEKMLNALLTEICEVFNADAADIYLMDPNVGLLYMLSHIGYHITEEAKYEHLSLDDTLRGNAVKEKHVVTYSTALQSDISLPGDETHAPKAIAITPVWAGGEIRGTLTVALWHENTFSDEELALLEALGRGVGLTIETARLYAETQSYAETLRLRVEDRTQELQKALLHAQSAERTKSALLSTVSHELRTPLSSIIGFSNLIISRKPQIEKAVEFANAINAEARRLADLINDFLDLQRIESGRQIFHFTELDLVELVLDVIHKQQLEDDDLHTIQLKLDPVPAVYADGNRIRQVILNLLSNALKYSPGGGEIVISLHQEDNEVVFSIHDDGLGIVPDELTRIFDHFYRSDVAERYRIRGTGLGLGLCKELIQVHNGRIWAESAGLNMGSTFTFTLPLLRPRETIRHKDDEQDSNRLLALIIDDDASFATYLGERLEGENLLTKHIHFKVATTDYIAELAPIVIFLDLLQGEERRGWDILRELKDNGKTKAIPVIVCSVLNVPDQARQYGAYAYLAKPVDEQKLMVEIERIVKQRLPDAPE